MRVVWLVAICRKFASGELVVEKEVSLRSLIALRGKPNMGKSQTVRTVVELLTTKHPDARIEHDQTTKVDERVVLTINDSKIGIESESDPSGRSIKESLDLFEKLGCQVIICATRPSGASVEAVNALRGFNIEWLEQREKSQPHEQVLRSLATARNIVEKVEALVGSTEPPARSRSATA